MKAAEKLMSRFGANIGESIEVNRPSGVTVSAPVGPNPYAGLERVKGALMIPVARIDPDPDQPRGDFDPEALDRLAASLRERGQLQPIRVRRAGDRWVIIAGERRWRAAALAGLDRLACVEHDRELTTDELLDVQLTENCLRDDLKPVEQARAYQTLLNRRGWTQAKLAGHLHVSQASVSKALALLGLPEDVQAAVDGGALPASDGYRIARADPAERPALVERVRARAGAETPAVKPQRVTFRVAGGRVAVTLDDPGGGAAGVLAALRAAVKAAEKEARGDARGAA